MKTEESPLISLKDLKIDAKQVEISKTDHDHQRKFKNRGHILNEWMTILNENFVREKIIEAMSEGRNSVTLITSFDKDVDESLIYQRYDPYLFSLHDTIKNMLKDDYFTIIPSTYRSDGFKFEINLFWSQWIYYLPTFLCIKYPDDAHLCMMFTVASSPLCSLWGICI